MNIYQEELLDHYRNPRNRRRIEFPDFSSGHHNPSCGDDILFEGTFEQGVLARVGFQGSGCVISQGLASMLSQKVTGMSVGDILLLNSEDVKKIIGMTLGPNRLRCALLPLQALHEGVRVYVATQGE